MAELIVFFVSAIFHEVLISLPLHMIRPWAYLGMMAQLPLVWITKTLTKKLPGTSMGNIIFWLSFCIVGQPMAILMYTIDYQFRKETDHVLSTTSMLPAFVNSSTVGTIASSLSSGDEL
jgi:diacylglycerol O-acyltransferase-1